MPYGYLLVTMNVSDPERYKQYMAEAPTAVKAFGGEYLVRGGKHETLEGEWNPHRIAVLRFPSYEKAKAFYNDPQYQQIRQKRLGATEYFHMVLVEGFEGVV